MIAQHIRSAILLAVLAGMSGSAASQQTPEWRTFAGTWSAAGHRHTLPTEGPRTAAIVRLSGAMVLTAGSDVGAGFLGEAIGYDDGAAAGAGRAVWTDSTGNRVFSTFTAEAFESGRRLTGTITGGTGRFAGAAGDYTLTWQYVIRSEDDTINGRAVDLKGRIRRSGLPR